MLLLQRQLAGPGRGSVAGPACGAAKVAYWGHAEGPHTPSGVERRSRASFRHHCGTPVSIRYPQSIVVTPIPA